MRLASKIFLTATLVIVVLAGVGVLSLRAVDRLVSVNREITTLTVPALRLAAGAAEAAPLEVRTGTAVLVALGAAVGRALCASGLVAYGMTRSLETLSEATARVAAGSFREPLPVESNDEIGQLARSFNSMAAQLRQMAETREEFFATLSHELRSPLPSIRRAADLLRQGFPGPPTEKQARLVEIIGGRTGRPPQLVNQNLQISPRPPR